MRSYFRIGLIGFALVLVLAAESSAQVNDILNRMDAHYKALKSLQANVTRVVYNSQIDESDKYAGTVSLLPGKGRNFSFRLDWTAPKQEMISVVNGKYVAYLPGIKQAYVGDSNSQTVKNKGGNALEIMTMSKEEIKSKYTAQYLGEEKISGGIVTWRLKLTPRGKENYKFIDLWVDGNGMPLQGKITMVNDDTDTILLTGLKKNVKIKASIFEIKLPNGTKEIPG